MIIFVYVKKWTKSAVYSPEKVCHETTPEHAKNARLSFFEWSPYVCPEPVLAKRLAFLASKGVSKERFSFRTVPVRIELLHQPACVQE
jgi:hypothetical protein